jgi:hypothetical protein
LDDFLSRHVPQSIWEEARQRSLDSSLREALLLLGELCPAAQRLEASAVSGSEQGEWWIDLWVYLREEVDGCLRALDAFSSRWSEVSPWEAQDSIRVIFLPTSDER